MKLFKSFVAITLVLVVCFSLAACTSGQTNTNTDDILGKELIQNDYRGGVQRTLSLQENILATMEAMKTNNKTIRSSNPNSYWTTDGYQDFVSTFLDIPILNDTQWFNEEETTWDAIITQISTTQNSFTVCEDGNYTLNSEVSIIRREKDEYYVTGVTDTGSLEFTESNSNISANGKVDYHIFYDCDKDWCKAYTEYNVMENLPKYTTQLFEYRRINENTFAIQTSRERILIELIPVEEDSDLRDRKIKSFYYSKLVGDGYRTTFQKFSPLPEADSQGLILSDNIKTNSDMAALPRLNEKGDYALRYGINDSVFLKSDSAITKNWVFEDNALQQALVYDNGVLVATTYNKLSKKYEQFVYCTAEADSAAINAAENVVKINALVGVN